MAISFSGISLLLETPEVEEYLSLYHSLDNLVEQSLGGIPGSGLDDVQNPPYRIADPVRVGVLYWPRDCSRCATFHCVVNSTKLDQIRAVVDGGVYQTLSLSDGVNDPVTCSMRMLPPRPLLAVTGAEQLYLLSLVDQRYDFTHHRAGSVETQPISWSALFSTVSSVLGESISVESVDSGYGTPSERWVKYQRPIAALTDAACSTIRQKFVANRDGTYETVGWETAQAASDFQSILYRKCGGGAIQQADIKRAVPASVNVVFLEVDGDGVPQAAPYVVTKNLVDLAISEYGDTVGITDNVQTIYADLIYDGSNASACESYAITSATDWYGWQLCDLDVTWAGIVPWEPTGAEDYIEWTYSLTGPGPRLTTRIQRGAWDGFPSGFGQSATEGPQGPRGKTGPPGWSEDGLDGERGPPGPRGQQGLQGLRGRPGPPIPGEDGAPGEQGVPGPRGRRGERGPRGWSIVGEDGEQGEQGIPGPRGRPGERGRTGPSIPGEEGIQGEQGVPGPRGRQGLRGRQGYPIPGEDGVDGDWGPPGRRGVPGPRGKVGPPIPGEDGQDTEQIYLIKKTVQNPADSSWKQPVRVATTQAGTLASSFENGDSIDGVTLSTGDRILIKNQSTASENGIYVVNASGAPTRSTDADTGGELLGAMVVVTQGTANADTVWMCTTNSPITVGSTGIAWAPVPRSTSSVTDNAIVRYSGTTGAVVSPAPATITDTSGGTLTVTNASINNVTVTNRTTFSSTASGGNIVFDESSIVYPPDVTGSYMCLLQGAVGFRFDSGRSRVINTGDFEIPTTASGFGLVLTDSSGGRWRLTINTLGSLVINSIP